MHNVEIINRGRGPEIAGTRITIYHVWEFYRAGDDRDEIALTFGLSSRQVQAALDYIAENASEVEREYAEIQARISQGNSESVEHQLQKNRDILRQRLREKGMQLA